MTRNGTVASVFGIAVLGVAVAGFVGCTSILGDFDVQEGAAPEAGAPPVEKENGQACAIGSDCTSGFCTDGVCCESSCSGTCESCKLDPGKCVPVPDGQNPDDECKPEPLADGGVVPEPDAEPPPPDAGDVGEGGIEGGTQPDASGTINFPDSGVTQDEAKCAAGVCDGNRRCRFPKDDVGCGTKFCNTSSEAAGFFCDGAGHCGLRTKTCAPFTCENNECQKVCVDQTDCDGDHFCATDQICRPKKGDGTDCTSPNQCASGFCVVEGAGPGVCCNTECDKTGVVGATCKKPGAVGKCQCSQNCGTGSCKVFYQDKDGDTFGNKLGSVSTATATVGCDNAAPPSGFVDNKTDCDDDDSRVRPTQTNYFDAPTAKGSFDYNCSDILEKRYAEYPRSSCQFCSLASDRKSCSSASTCSTTGAQSRLTCTLYPATICTSLNCSPTCGFSKVAPNTGGFTANVGCGVSATYTTCGSCSAPGLGPSVTTSTVKQACR